MTNAPRTSAVRPEPSIHATSAAQSTASTHVETVSFVDMREAAPCKDMQTTSAKSDTSHKEDSTRMMACSRSSDRVKGVLGQAITCRTRVGTVKWPGAHYRRWLPGAKCGFQARWRLCSSLYSEKWEVWKTNFYLFFKLRMYSNPFSPSKTF